MKDDSNLGGANVCNIGYHFSRFRAKDWHRLYIENACKFGHSEEMRVLKLKGLRIMGFLLMTVGFLICLNAVYRTPGVRQTAAPIEINEASRITDSESAALKGRGD
jgi:hypothetical protein